mmetsp:Transcript_105590/g.128870  ORF Transcript_105590/g.128870 Transcript_105590/m.128870 type:complete len:166 (-) Transcript_105590:181-678(-)
MVAANKSPNDQNIDSDTIIEPRCDVGKNSANIAPSTGKLPPTPNPNKNNKHNNNKITKKTHKTNYSNNISTTHNAKPSRAKKTTKQNKPKTKSNKKSNNFGINNNVTITVNDIKNKTYPSNLNRAKLELYLSNDEFRHVFGKTKDEWKKIPEWQQKRKKKELGLF